jgi:hypothetical protein
VSYDAILITPAQQHGQPAPSLGDSDAGSKAPNLSPAASPLEIPDLDDGRRRLEARPSQRIFAQTNFFVCAPFAQTPCYDDEDAKRIRRRRGATTNEFVFASSSQPSSPVVVFASSSQPSGLPTPVLAASPPRWACWRFAVSWEPRCRI